MKVVIAPDTFKESLSAVDAAQALAQGVLKARPDAQIDLCPMADGGEGTVAAMVAATGGQFITADVFGPLGQPVRARLGLMGAMRDAALPGEAGYMAAVAFSEGGQATGGHTAVIEMAAASGLALVPGDLRNPLKATTFGTGQLIMNALDTGARDILIGLGGSATCDGGVGCAQALGIVFLDSRGEAMRCGLGGGDLMQIHGINVTGREPRLAQARIFAACDVTNPLTGPTGAAAIFGPQKGATPEQVRQLDAGLARLAAIIRRDLGVDVENMPGAGAAGGLGAGLVAFVDAKIQRGVEIVAQAVHLGRRLCDADLVLTGEDGWTARVHSARPPWAWPAWRKTPACRLSASPAKRRPTRRAACSPPCIR